MKREKLSLLVAGVIGFGMWGVAGYAIRGWQGMQLTLTVIGLIACVGYTLGSTWRYFTLPETHVPSRQPEPEDGDFIDLTLGSTGTFDPEVVAALDEFRLDTNLNPFGPPSTEEANARILRDWLIGHGYLIPPVDDEDVLRGLTAAREGYGLA